MSTFFCIVLPSCVGRGLAMGRYPVQRAPPPHRMSKKSFIASEINSELEKTTGPNVCDNLRWSEVEIM
jgi:hypothetical protein